MSDQVRLVVRQQPKRLLWYSSSGHVPCGGINLKEEGMRKVLSLLLTCALVLMVASVAFAGDAQTVNGWISDSKCGVKGANASHAGCAKKCIAGGESAVVVTDQD